MMTFEIQNELGAIGIREEDAETGKVHRRVVHPGSIEGETYVATDLSGEPPELQDFCADAWTQEVHSAWEAKLRADIVPVVVPVPESISDRQFFQMLAVNGVITEGEALAAVQTGTIPAAMAALVDGLPEQSRFSARMLVSGATEFRRSHPLTGVFGAAFGWSDADIDAFFEAAAAL